MSSGIFDQIALDALHAPMYKGDDPDDALRFVAGQQSAVIGKLSDDAQRRALQQLRTDLAAHLGDDGVHYDSAAWLIPARRR